MQWEIWIFSPGKERKVNYNNQNYNKKYEYYTPAKKDNQMIYNQNQNKNNINYNKNNYIFNNNNIVNTNRRINKRYNQNNWNFFKL